MTQAILTCLIYATIPEKFYPSTRRFPQAWQNNASDAWTHPHFRHTPGKFDARDSNTGDTFIQLRVVGRCAIQAI